MDKIWDRKSRSLAVVAGMKKTNDHAEPTTVERLKKLLLLRIYQVVSFKGEHHDNSDICKQCIVSLCYDSTLVLQRSIDTIQTTSCTRSCRTSARTLPCSEERRFRYKSSVFLTSLMFTRTGIGEMFGVGLPKAVIKNLKT